METVLPVAIIGLIAGLLAYHNDYDDGFIGRFSFGVIVLTSVIVVLGIALGYYTYELPIELELMLWAVAAFMGRHCWRFIYFNANGRCAWDGRDRRARSWDGNDRRSRA